MTARCTLSVCLLVGISSQLVSCQSDYGLITTFSDITSEVQRDGAVSDTNQNRLISLAGMLLHTNAGDLLRYKHSRNPTTAIGISPDEGPSYIVTRQTAEDVELKDVIAVRDHLISVRTLAARVVELRLELAFQRALAAASTSGDDAADSLLNPSGDLKTVEAAYKKARKEFEAAAEKAQKELNTSGILVIRWAVKSAVAASLDLGNIAGLEGLREALSSGFAVFGGLRTSQIFLGSDFGQVQSGIKGGIKFQLDLLPILIEPDNDDVRLVTYTIETRHVAYVQDFSSLTAVAARIQASYDQLANIGETLRELDKIEIATVFARVEELSNMALLGPIKEERYRAPWNEVSDDQQQEAQQRPDQRQADQQQEGEDLPETKRQPKDDQRDLLSFKALVETYTEDDTPAQAGESKGGWRIVYAVDVDFENIQWYFR